MKTKIGIVCMVLGSVLVSLALGLYLYNANEQKQAADAVDQLMPQLVDAIQARQDDPPETAAPTEATAPVEDDTQTVVTLPQKKVMPVAEIDGDPYIGFVSIPKLELELPVMDDWDYKKLKKAPCRFTGDLYSNDLVIMAHNYVRHFGPIRRLRTGDTVIFTDIDGVATKYAVMAVDVLGPTAVEEMTAGEFDLTLFTCTYGGKTRVTVRCDRIAD